jgi:hypothetical protein
MFIESNAAHPVGYNSPLQNKWLVRFQFLKKRAKLPLLSVAGYHTRPYHSEVKTILDICIFQS